VTDRRVRNSAVNLFTDCPRLWMLSYWMDLEKDYGLRVKDSAADTGNSFHAGVEAWRRGDDPIERIRTDFFGKPASADSEAVDGLIHRLNPSADIKKFTDRCVDLPTIMVNNFVQWQTETGQGMGERSLWIEAAVDAKVGTILGDEVTMFGRIDHLIELDNGDLIIDDNKSVESQGFTSDLALHQNRQLLNYAMMVWLNLGKMPVMARHTKAKRWKRTKPGPDWSDSFLINEVRINEKMLAVHWTHLSSILTRMVDTMQKLDLAKSNGEDPAHHFLVPPNPSKDCNWMCSFTDICPMMDDPNSDWTALLDDQYRPRDKDGN